ncbi:MAG TPA: C-terminal binding protein [Methylomirabilota bacterium]|nr:C-terminal binding protein [Methylomirabilota bacterium]
MSRVLVLAHVFPDLAPERAVLEPRGVEVVDGTPLDPAARVDLALDADALLVQYSTVDATLIARLRRCRVIGSYGVGYDQIDVAAAATRGITVVHVPDYGTEEVSDHTLCLLLGLARGLPGLQAGLRAGGWDYAASGPLRRLRGRTLGIVGLGRIGRRVAAKARPFGLRVLAADPYLPTAVFVEHGVEPRPLDRLLAESDFVSLHVPLTEETRGLLDARAFRLMRPGACLINAARGPVVDDAALLDALERGHLAGAGLDVLAVEPPPAGHPLLRHPRVLVTPHSAWYTEEAMRDLQRLLAEDVGRVLAGRPARCPVPAARPVSA